MRSNLLLLTIIFATLALTSCKKENDDYKPEQISDYAPLAVGKRITYRVDSTVFWTNFGRTTEIHSYQQKDSVEALITDNLGRPSYRILRFQRDTLGVTPWKPAGTYFMTPLQNTLEVVENNQRIVKLSLPLKQDYTWKGNRYLPTEPYSSSYNFSNDDDMSSWDFTVTGTGETDSINGRPIDNIVTLMQADESINVPIADNHSYAAINYSKEQYAKGIGLVMQEFIMWEYQPNPGGTSPYKTGFGVKRTMIEHN